MSNQNKLKKVKSFFALSPEKKKAIKKGIINVSRFVEGANIGLGKAIGIKPKKIKKRRKVLVDVYY